MLFPNLAGVATCDKTIVEELEEAGISIVSHPDPYHTEVPASIAGKLGKFSFVRAWSYYIVTGDVPLAVAEIMYSNPVGQKDIRVAGNCGCPSPKGWAEWRNPVTHRKILATKEKTEAERFKDSISKSMQEVSKKILTENDFADDPSAIGEGFITFYHIDSQRGLNLFVKTLWDNKIS